MENFWNLSSVFLACIIACKNYWNIIFVFVIIYNIYILYSKNTKFNIEHTIYVKNYYTIFLLIGLQNITDSLNSEILKESSFRTCPDALPKPVQMDCI